MQPLSNYREHPVDNLFYSVVTSVGVVTAGAAFALGCEFKTVDRLGINSFLFVFNFAGYNLRHSHIWLAWPGFAGYLLGSPAYHQIHHSYDECHINKNLGFLFSVWDWLHGSLYMPREHEDLHFGLGDGTEPEYSSVLRLDYLPFLRLDRNSRATEETPETEAPST
jgi:sterol desaturase/sphingolipid hydroxylase (fatty acid hydroxylase superfamily)